MPPKQPAPTSPHSTFTHCQTKGIVYPLPIHRPGSPSDSSHHHSKHFHVEFPAGSRTIYRLDASRLVAITGDGATSRTFRHQDIASILASISHRMDLSKLLPRTSF